MKIYFLLILLSISFFAQSQTFNSSCAPTSNEKVLCWNDAFLLATKRAHDINSPFKDSVLLPSIFVDSIAGALYAMQNMDYAPIKDTILSLFGFSNFVFGNDSLHTTNAGGDWNYDYYLKSIVVVVNNNTNWGADWAAGNYNNTANDSVNYLINTYGLTVSLNSYQVYSDSTIYVVSSPVDLNIPALVKQFSVIGGVAEARTASNPGTGKYIGAYILNGDVYLTYNYSCGDCPSGCTYGREWQFRVNTSTDCSVNYSYEANWGNFLQWATQGSCFDAIVPVQFTSVQAFEKNNTNMLQWQVAMETDVANYIIQRSTDGINYSPIGEVQPRNTPSAPSLYSFTDNNFTNGTVYYRIELINNSGTIKYSSIVKLAGKKNTFITAYPSLLTSNTLNIQFNKVDKDVYFINLVNASGQKLFSSQIKSTAETFTLQLQMPLKLPRGIYTLSVNSKSVQLNQLIVAP